MKHLALVPLIGGMAIGTEQALGVAPEAVLSYSAFELNDSYYMRYLAKRGLNIKRYDIEQDTIPSFGEVDIATSVCPCSGLSMANRTSGPGCKQNDWMYLSTEYALKHVKPRVLIGENAPRLYGQTGAPVAQNLASIGKEFGYSTQLVKTSTHFHGIPQKRERSFFILWRDHDPHVLNAQHNEYHGTWVDFLDQFQGNSEIMPLGGQSELMLQLAENFSGLSRKALADAMAEKNCSVTKFVIDNHWDQIQEYAEEHFEEKQTSRGSIARRFRNLRIKWETCPNTNYYDNSPGFRSKPFFPSVMFKSRASVLHPREMREITDREAMRLMGLPEDMDLPSLKHSNVIAQNVPTCTAKWMVGECVKVLQGENSTKAENISKDGIYRWSNLNNKESTQVKQVELVV